MLVKIRAQVNKNSTLLSVLWAHLSCVVVVTTPQPQNDDAPLVAIGGYNDTLSVGIDLCQHLTAAAESGVGIGL